MALTHESNRAVRIGFSVVVLLTGAGSLTSITTGHDGAQSPVAGVHATVDIRDSTASYSRDVYPILKRSCLECHGAEGQDGERRVEEGLDMTTYEGLMIGSLYGTVVEPGDPEASYLIELIVDGDMPKEGEGLTDAEIAIISTWIAEGALNN